MAHQHKLGTSKHPIEILDSDDESDALGPSSFIDLTQDVFVPHTRSMLQQPTIESKDTSASSATDLHPQRLQPLRLASQQFSFAEGQNKVTPSTAKNEARPFNIPNHQPLQALHTDRDGLVEKHHESISQSDADSELSDIMERSCRRRPRRAHQRSSGNADDTRFNIPTSRSSILTKLSSELGKAEPQRAHDGNSRQRSRFSREMLTISTDPTSHNQRTSSPLLVAVEEVLRSIWRDMGRDHALYVKDQLQEALKRSEELRGSLPQFSDAIDPFAEMPAIHERNATQTKDQVSP